MAQHYFRVREVTDVVATCDCPVGADSDTICLCQDLLVKKLNELGIKGWEMTASEVCCGDREHKVLTATRTTLKLEEY